MKCKEKNMWVCLKVGFMYLCIYVSQKSSKIHQNPLLISLIVIFPIQVLGVSCPQMPKSSSNSSDNICSWSSLATPSGIRSHPEAPSRHCWGYTKPQLVSMVGFCWEHGHHVFFVAPSNIGGSCNSHDPLLGWADGLATHHFGIIREGMEIPWNNHVWTTSQMLSMHVRCWTAVKKMYATDCHSIDFLAFHNLSYWRPCLGMEFE